MPTQEALITVLRILLNCEATIPVSLQANLYHLAARLER
jgi:hypothetical protein